MNATSALSADGLPSAAERYLRSTSTLGEIGGAPSPALLLCLMCAWYVVTKALKVGLDFALMSICAKTSPSLARLPKAFPVADPHGETEEWETIVEHASEEHIRSFLAFRGYSAHVDRELASREAVKYRAELFDMKWVRYLHDRFGLGKPAAYPGAMKPWAGWAGWWGELGPAVKGNWTGHLLYGAHHALCGLVALVYLRTGDVLAFNAALYLELSFNLLDLALATPAILGKTAVDRTIWTGCRRSALVAATPAEEMRGFHKILLNHHLAAAGLELFALSMVRTPAAARLTCRFMIAMVGTTATMHTLANNSDVTPLKNDPLSWFALTATTLALILWHRFFAFVPMAVQAVSEANGAAGPLGGLVVLGLMCLFTEINVSFVRLYLSKIKLAWARLRDSRREASGKAA